MKFNVRQDMFGTATVTLHPDSKRKIKKILFRTAEAAAAAYWAVQIVNYFDDKNKQKENQK